MAAGLGFKDFVTGEVLTAADVDGYLMQGVWVFASAAARDAAVTSPQEGNFAYLKDTNVTTYYTGSAWANLDTTGMTNPMTTTGDTIYSSSGSTPARLGIGTANQVLRVNSGATAPEWATVSSGGMTLISETVASALSSLSFSSLGSYKQLLLVWHGIQHNAASNIFNIRFNSDSGNNYIWFNNYWGGGHGHEVSTQSYACQQGIAPFGYQTSGAGASEVANGFLLLDNYTSTTKTKAYQIQNFMRTPGDSAGDSRGGNTTGYYNSTSAITSIDVFRQSGASTFSNYSNTTIRLYGLS